MESIGQKLRAARESKELTIESLSERTRINRDFIVAMENNDFEFLPRPYVRGFLKQIATAVGLDPYPLLAELDAPTGASEDSASGREGSGEPGESGEERSSGEPQGEAPAGGQGELSFDPGRAPETRLQVKEKRLEWILGATAVVLLLSILVVYARLTNSVPSASEVGVEELPLEVAIQAADSLADNREPLQPEPLRLQAVAEQTTWMRVVIDDNDTTEVILREGQQVSWQAGETFRLRFGNAGGVRLLLDGEELGRPGRSGQVVSITVTRDGIVERRVHAPKKAPADSAAADTPSDPAVISPASGDRHGVL